jgi:predicted enzyme related to lactoylglutathione lyase
MLSEAPIGASLPAADLYRANHFYSEVLGLKKLPFNVPGMMMFGAGDSTRFVLYEKNIEPAEHTVAAFVVQDLTAEVNDLKSKGVKFEEFEIPGLKTENSIIDFGFNKTAWFRDSEGNLISMTQTIE